MVSKGLGKEIDKISTKILNDYSLFTKKSFEHVEDIEKLMTKSKERFNSYYRRKKLIDYLIYINLVIAPVLFLIIFYIVFIKK